MGSHFLDFSCLKLIPHSSVVLSLTDYPKTPRRHGVQKFWVANPEFLGCLVPIVSSQLATSWSYASPFLGYKVQPSTFIIIGVNSCFFKLIDLNVPVLVTDLQSTTDGSSSLEADVPIGPSAPIPSRQFGRIDHGEK